MKEIMLLAFVAIQIADVYSTNRVLSAGGWEANPIVASAIAGLGAWWWLPKLGLMVACAAFMSRWPVRYVAIATALMGVVVVNNLLQ
jgi:hypothetical protein